MYYHCRPLKYVEYGKVIPPPIETFDDWIVPAYQWVGHYCNFFPQIWLSRSASEITGFKLHHNKDSVLFAFDVIKGFPLQYNTWEFVMGCLLSPDLVGASKEKMNQAIQNGLRLSSGWSFENKYDDDCKSQENLVSEWRKTGNLEESLKKHLFVESDQVVVPTLNLKVAKQIICRNEKQKKTLRKMGFIEDRILIKNIKFRR